MRHPIAIVLVVMLAGCGGSQGFGDGGRDAPATESGAADSGQDGGDSADESAMDVPADNGEQDAGNGLDAPVEADANDAGTDGDANASTDAGPADAGPTSFDLAAQYTAPEFHVLYEQTCDPTQSGCMPFARSVVATNFAGQDTACSFLNGRMNFDVWACDDTASVCADLNGYVYSSASGGATLLVLGTSAPDAVLTDRGPSYAVGGTMRQNFHLQFSRSATGHYGVMGIAGETVSPDLGDLWLLGCPVQ